MGHEGAGIAAVRGDAVAPEGASRDVREAADRARNPLSDLRPVSTAAVLDGGVDLLAHRVGRFAALTACLYVPVWLGSIVLAVAAPPSLSGGSAGVDLTGMSTATSSSLTWVIVALQALALSVLGLCAGHLAMALARGGDAPLRELGALAWRRSWVAIVLVVLNTAVKVPALCLGGVGWFLVDAFVFVSSVVAGAEALGPWSAFRRGWRLTGSQLGRALVISFGGFCITQLIRLSLSYGPTVLIDSLAPGSVFVTAYAVLSTAVLLVTQPLTACIAARAYLDLRCRREGLDLELRHERLLLELRGAPA